MIDVLTENPAKFKNLVNQVASFEEAPTRDHESVLNWILKEKPLCNGSYDFIWHKGDFASLKGSPVQGGGSGKAGFFENIILALAPYGLFNVSTAHQYRVLYWGKTNWLTPWTTEVHPAGYWQRFGEQLFKLSFWASQKNPCDYYSSWKHSYSRLHVVSLRYRFGCSCLHCLHFRGIVFHHGIGCGRSIGR